MKIFLTNDDGFDAPGILTLKQGLEEKGHEVWICAPSVARSTTSQSMTFHGDIIIEKHGERYISCSGYPADCVIYGISGHLLPLDFDLVISGINRGYNNSSDIHYSGTCGAAKEASLMGYKSIAISAEKNSRVPDPPYRKAVDFLTAHLDELVSSSVADHYININVPFAGDVSDYSSATAECVRVYKREITTESLGDGRFLCHTKDNGMVERNKTDKCDVSLTERGIISVSSVQIAPTCIDIDI